MRRELPRRCSVAWDQRGWSTSGSTFATKPYSSGCWPCQKVAGRSAVSVIRVIDLMLLNPYFHGTTSRTGGPVLRG